MKNRVYESNPVGVANFLVDRENVFNVRVATEGIAMRKAKGDSYRSNLVDVKLNMGYRVNVFVDLNKVKVALPRREYTVFLKYIDYHREILSFKFSIEESVLDFDLLFADYVDDFEGASSHIDKQISSKIEKDIHSIFNGDVYIDDENSSYKNKYKIIVKEYLNIDVSSVYIFS